MTFRTFDDGIRIARGFAADPATGKVGELYWNTARLLLRQCVNATGPIWEDVTVKAGTTPFGTLYWNAVNGRWQENVLLLIDGRKIYAANSAAASPLLIQSGDTTDPGITGSNVVLQPGTGALGQGEVEFHALNVSQSVDLGTALNIFAGDSTVNPAGNDLNLSAGQGTATLGDTNVIGEDVNLNAGDKIRLNGEVVFSQILVADPATPETAQLYWHDGFKRFRKFDGINWHWIDASRYNSPIVVVDLFDDTILTLPADTSTLVDGTVVTDGMLVVMQNSGSPVVYLATLAGINITWTAQNPGQSPTVNPAAGDSIYVRAGTANIDTFLFFQSTGVWVDPSGSTNAPITAGNVIDDTVRWNGTAWVPDSSVKQDGFGRVYGQPNTDNDAVKADTLAIQGGAKTDGTGDGGDVLLQGGTSAGGIQGDVEVEANSLILPTPFGAVPRNAGVVFDNNRLKPKIAYAGVYRDLDSADINGEITGFVNTTDSTISFVNGTLTFTIAQVGLTPFQFYIKGQLFTKDTVLFPQTVVITNTVGNHYIYFDALGVLTSNTIYDLQSGLKNTCLVAVIHWNGTSASLIADRRHLLTMDGDARFNKRNTNPIEVKNSDFLISGISDFNTVGVAGWSFVVGAGSKYVEELVTAVPSVSIAASEIPVISLNSTNQMVRAAATNRPLLNNGVDNVYNLNTLGTWSQTAITSGNYVNTWLVLTNDINFPIALLMPQAQWTTLADAQRELPTSLSSFFPSTEFKVLARLTFQSFPTANHGARLFTSMTDYVPSTAKLSDLTLNANTDRDLYHQEAVNVDMYFNPATGDVTWTGDILIPVTGLIDTANTLSAQTVNLADGQVAYVTLNRDNSVTTVLPVTVGAPSQFQTQNGAQEDRVIILKRIAGEVYFMRGNAEKLRKRQVLVDNQVAPASIFNFPNPTAPNGAYQVEFSIYRNGTVETGILYVVRGAVGNVGQSIAGASNGSTGVVLTVAESGSTLQLQYTSTSTGSIPVIRYKVSTWLTT